MPNNEICYISTTFRFKALICLQIKPFQQPVAYRRTNTAWTNAK